eukprot:763857-Hanusia_phi.AAC.4
MMTDGPGQGRVATTAILCGDSGHCRLDRSLTAASVLVFGVFSFFGILERDEQGKGGRRRRRRRDLRKRKMLRLG